MTKSDQAMTKMGYKYDIKMVSVYICGVNRKQKKLYPMLKEKAWLVLHFRRILGYLNERNNDR